MEERKKRKRFKFKANKINNLSESNSTCTRPRTHSCGY